VPAVVTADPEAVDPDASGMMAAEAVEAYTRARVAMPESNLFIEKEKKIREKLAEGMKMKNCYPVSHGSSITRIHHECKYFHKKDPNTAINQPEKSSYHSIIMLKYGHYLCFCFFMHALGRSRRKKETPYIQPASKRHKRRTNTV
jgi:hypothetical protein